MSQQEEEEEVTSAMDELDLEDRNPRTIDMKSGFMRSIIRNQIDRDEYDRAHRKSLPCSPRSPQKPSAQLYVPPHRKPKCPEESREYREKTRERIRREIDGKQKDTAPQVTVTDDKPGEKGKDKKEKPAFKLDLEDFDGKVHSLYVYHGDTAARVAKIFAQKLGLSDEYSSQLRIRISSEMEKRNMKY